MTHAEIREALINLDITMQVLEEEYIENGGEITTSTEQKEAQIESLKHLLKTDAVDSLGRWLKGKQDNVKSLQAEKAYIDRRIQAEKRTSEYIMSLIHTAMVAAGEEKVKGQNGYSFALSQSTTTSVDQELLEEKWQAEVENLAREAGMPDYVTISLKAKKSLVPEGLELPDIFQQTTTDTVAFRKPKKATEPENS